MRVGCSLLFLTAALFAAETPARAGPSDCASAYEQAQRSRKASKLVESRTRLLACSQETCPAFIRRDCAGWLTEVERELPSVAVRVLDRQGCDRPDVMVWVDGRAIPGAAGGTSVDLDPGTHGLRAELEGAMVEQTIVLVRGERDRIVTLAAGTVTSCTPTKPLNAPAPPVVPRAPERDAAQPVPALAFVFGGIGVVGVGLGTAFAISGWTQRGSLDDCRGTCRQDDVGAARRAFVVADIGIGVGLVALVTAAVVYFTR